MSTAAQRLAFKERTRELVDLLLAERKECEAAEEAEYRREGDTWYFPSKTDKHEAEHRVDIHCTCAGFTRWRYCQHIVRAIELAKAARG